MIFGSFRPLVLCRALARLPGEIAELRQEMRVFTREVQRMSTGFDNLKAAVMRQISIDQSAVTLIQGIAAQLRAPDADAQALADQLDAAAAPLSAAVLANTPAAAPNAPAAGTATTDAGSSGSAASTAPDTMQTNTTTTSSAS